MGERLFENLIKELKAGKVAGDLERADFIAEILKHRGQDISSPLTDSQEQPQESDIQPVPTAAPRLYFPGVITKIEQIAQVDPEKIADQVVAGEEFLLQLQSSIRQITAPYEALFMDVAIKNDSAKLLSTCKRGGPGLARRVWNGLLRKGLSDTAETVKSYCYQWDDLIDLDFIIRSEKIHWPCTKFSSALYYDEAADSAVELKHYDLAYKPKGSTHYEDDHLGIDFEGNRIAGVLISSKIYRYIFGVVLSLKSRRGIITETVNDPDKRYLCSEMGITEADFGFNFKDAEIYRVMKIIKEFDKLNFSFIFSNRLALVSPQGLYSYDGETRGLVRKLTKKELERRNGVVLDNRDSIPLDLYLKAMEESLFLVPVLHES